MKSNRKSKGKDKKEMDGKLLFKTHKTKREMGGKGVEEETRQEDNLLIHVLYSAHLRCWRRQKDQHRKHPLDGKLK